MCPTMRRAGQVVEMSDISIYDMGLEKKTLYQCRGCSAISGSKIGPCPACEYSEGPTKERGKLDGGTREVQLPWYKTIEVVVEP